MLAFIYHSIGKRTCQSAWKLFIPLSVLFGNLLYSISFAIVRVFWFAQRPLISISYIKLREVIKQSMKRDIKLKLLVNVNVSINANIMQYMLILRSNKTKLASFLDTHYIYCWIYLYTAVTLQKCLWKIICSNQKSNYNTVTA